MVRIDSWARLQRLVLGSILCVMALAWSLLSGQVAHAAEIGSPQLTEATSAIICDDTGEVLWAQDADVAMEPASITKIMTAMVALDSQKPLDDVCSIQEIDLGGESQTVGYVATDAPTFEELLLAMLVFSGNDAANNVALNVCGTLEEFVALMNDKAASIGMTGTHFENVHGLEQDGHRSCAADLVLMGRYALEHYPFIARAAMMPSVEVTADGRTFTLDATDKLLEAYDGIRGIKTGAVESGAAFLGACRRMGITLYTCVLGCKTLDGRFVDTAALLDWAYGVYRQRTFAHAGWVLRVCGFADNFALRCVVRVPAEGVSGYVWPAGADLSFRNAMCDSGTLVIPGQAYGTARWTQGRRLVAGACWEVEPALYLMPYWRELSYQLLSPHDVRSTPVLGGHAT